VGREFVVAHLFWIGHASEAVTKKGTPSVTWLWKDPPWYLLLALAPPELGVISPWKWSRETSLAALS